jgi:outer membrane protein
MTIAIATIGWLGLGAATAGAEPVSLGQAYALALQQSEDVRIGEEGMRQAQDDIRRATSAVLPKVTLTGTITGYPEEQGPFGVIQPQHEQGAEAKVEQPLFAGGKNAAGRRIAQRSVDVAVKDVRLAREQLLLRVTQVYYALLRAQKNVTIQTRNVERLAEHRRLSELRYKVGEVTESILLRAEAELAGARAELVARENDAAVAKRELQLLTGLPDAADVAEPPLPQLSADALESLRAAARQNRDDLLKSQLQERIATDRVAFARGSLFPTVTLEGTYFRRDQDPRSPFFLDQSWSVGGRIEFPIFEGGLRMAELRQAKSRLKQGRLATTRLAKQIDLDVTRASLTVDAVTRALESRQEQYRFATKNYEMVSKQFTFGLATNLDVLDANQTLIEAERDVIAATYDKHLAILDVQRSAGVFLTEALKAMPGNQT